MPEKYDGNVDEIPYERAQRMLGGEEAELTQKARVQLEENYRKKGDGWQWSDPRYHFWKGMDEFFKATAACDGGDLLTMEKRIGDGLNHIWMASYLAYSDDDDAMQADCCPAPAIERYDHPVCISCGHVFIGGGDG